ncbi:MAG TPA: hypothetical protein VHO72_04845 [Bacteroidales bacterium]|nr:hypothetical protein [Bacteroidales bacterium]
MSKPTKIVLIIVAAIILLFIGFYYFFIKGYIPKYRWVETYSYQSEQPYGLKLLYEALSSPRERKNFVIIKNSPKPYLEGADSTSLFMFIGGQFITDSATCESMMNFVHRGNHVFISSINSTHNLFQFLTNWEHPMIYYNYYSDSVVNVVVPSIPDSVFKFNYRVVDKSESRHWYGFEQPLLRDTLSKYGFESVSHIDSGLVDCFRIKYGKGWFIFHHNPVLLTNYYLAQEKGLSYVNALLSSYSATKIYWDEFSKTSFTEASPKESPLRFILSEKSFRWAWYLLFVLITLFVVFNAKRKQAAIPLLPFNKNTTIEYVTAIATLHYQNKSLNYLADEMMKQFLAFVKHRYGISPNLDKSEIAKQLAPLSGIPYETLESLFKRYLDVKYMPDVKYLIEFYKLTAYFYLNCK